VIRRLIVTVLAALVVLVGFAVARASRPDRVVGYGQIRFNGAGPERWAARYRRTKAELVDAKQHATQLELALRKQRRVLLADPHVAEAINLACAAYGYCSTLWRKARCETGGTFDEHAYNASGASGLFQFLGSTWRSTPYGRFSVWSPYASSLAAGWMHAHGRGGEWVCP
jgi:hypothetical protein